MCEHGDTVPVRVKVTSWLAWEGVDTWKDKQIDRCIAPIVRRIQAEGIDMLASCCGHGRGQASIIFTDGQQVYNFGNLQSVDSNE